MGVEEPGMKAVRLTALLALMERMRVEDPELWKRVIEFSKRPPREPWLRFKSVK